MNYFVHDMNRKYAAVISNWTYEHPYNINNGDKSDENIDELLDGSYYVVLDEKDELIGFFCLGNEAQVPAGNKYNVYYNSDFLDIGLGIRPDLCGKGKGYDFMMKQLDFAQFKFLIKNFRLTVAGVNKRVIKLYEKVGFVRTMSFEREKQDGNMEFLIMEKIK